MKTKGVLVCLMFFCALCSCANLLENGSFEDPVYPIDTHLYHDSSPNGLTGWTIVLGDMEIVSWSAADGNQSIELEGDGAEGIIFQTFSTTIDQMYTYSFAYSDNPYNNAPDTARVDFINSYEQVIETQVVTGPGANSTSDVQWQTASGSFTATSTSTTIRFTALNSNGFGGVGVCIDNVSVVPEPASIALFGLASGLGLFVRRRFLI